jgi:hypothetical protein
MEHSTRPTTRYRVPRDKEGNFIDVELHVPHLRAENLSLQTWGSSYILASQLHRFVEDIQLSRRDTVQILELGAGTGLVGLSAAALFDANVILTDLEPIVPGLAKNIKANSELLAGKNACAACGSLDWNQPLKLIIKTEDKEMTQKTLSSATDKATVVLAADTIYSEEHPRMLSSTILAWLKPGTTSRAIISYPLRVAYLDAIRELWELLEAGGLQCLDEGKAETGDEWDDERSHEWSLWAWQQERENE